MQSPTTRKKKTKLEKIAELETKCKALKEENRRLRGATASGTGTGTGGSGGGNSLAAKLAQTADDAWSETNNSSVSEWTESPSIASSIGGTVGGDTDKLKEALRALKRVTVKQEMTLATLRQKAKQRRNEIDEKDRIIQQLQEENEAYQKAHKDLSESNGKSGGETINTLRLRLADVQILLAKEKKERQEKSVLLEESQKKVSCLKKELSSLSSSSKGEAGGGSGKGPGSGDDYSRLKRELAKKTELIATLQHDLEVRKDEIHDLKQREVFHSSFQQSPFKQQSSVGTDDDFFDSDDDDFWT